MVPASTRLAPAGKWARTVAARCRTSTVMSTKTYMHGTCTACHSICYYHIQSLMLIV